MERRSDRWRDVVLGRAYALFTHDYRRARKAFETAFPDGFRPEETQDLSVDYLLALQRTLGNERVIGRIDKAIAYFESQPERRFESEFDPRFFLATLYAMKGDSEATVRALRQDAADGGLSCTVCLRVWPHFDPVRDDAVFKAFVAEAEAHTAAERQRLTDENLLLTPAQVLAHKDFDFDPFSQ